MNTDRAPSALPCHCKCGIMLGAIRYHVEDGRTLCPTCFHGLFTRPSPAPESGGVTDARTKLPPKAFVLHRTDGEWVRLADYTDVAEELKRVMAERDSLSAIIGMPPEGTDARDEWYPGNDGVFTVHQMWEYYIQRGDHIVQLRAEVEQCQKERNIMIDECETAHGLYETCRDECIKLRAALSAAGVGEGWVSVGFMPPPQQEMIEAVWEWDDTSSGKPIRHRVVRTCAVIGNLVYYECDDDAETGWDDSVITSWRHLPPPPTEAEGGRG